MDADYLLGAFAALLRPEIILQLVRLGLECGFDSRTVAWVLDFRGALFMEKTLRKRLEGFLRTW